MGTELTATEENVANQLNDRMNLAINKVMGVETQSYDDFMNGFQHITKEDAAYKKVSSSQLPHSKTDGKKSTVIETVPLSNRTEQTSNVLQSEQTSDEELEEEVLDVGTTVKSGTSCASVVKFDNFVDEIDDETETSGYIASFGENKKILIPNDLKNYEAGDSSTDIHEENNTETCKTILTDTLNCEENSEPDIKSEIFVQEDKIEILSSEKGLNDNSSQETPGSNIDPMALYPGEADPELDLNKRETTHTHLSFTTIKCIEPCDQTKQVCSTCTDEVQPFSLDDGFDYDNVTLTPKFTAQEVQYLKSFLPQN